MTSRPLRIALVVFGDPYLLPPTLAAAELLARRGHSVEILGVRWRGLPRLDDDDPPGVRTRILLTVGGGVGYTLSYLRFCAWACDLARRQRYDWVYAYDMMAAPLGQAMAKLAGGRWAYHCHDLSTDEELSRQQRFLRCRRFELAAAREAAFVVFPQAERARIFAREARLREPPLIVWNCPLRSWPDGASRANAPDARVLAMKSRYPRLVVYQGGLGADRGVGALLASLPQWPDGVGLVIAGLDVPAGRAGALLEQASAQGCRDHVLLLDPLPYRALPSVTRACHVGVLLADPRRDGNVNLQFHAGAANKIFEYMACGLAVLAPDTDGFSALIEAPTPRRGLVCRDRSPRAVAALISELLSPAGAPMGPANAAAFRAELNYEHQFAPALARLEA